MITQSLASLAVALQSSVSDSLRWASPLVSDLPLYDLRKCFRVLVACVSLRFESEGNKEKHETCDAGLDKGTRIRRV